MQSYKHNRSKDHRTVRPESVIVSGLILGVLLVAGFIFVDMALTQPAVNTEENTPVTLGTYTPRANEKKYKFTTELYELELPGEWKLVENRRRSIANESFAFVSFQGTAGDQLGRELEIYTDEIPVNIPVSRLANVSVNSANELSLIRSSGHCSSFTKIPDDAGSDPVASKWDDFEFMCDIIDYKNSTAAVMQPDFSGLKLEGETEEHTFLLVYYDHGELQSEVVFQEVLESFKILY